MNPLTRFLFFFKFLPIGGNHVLQVTLCQRRALQVLMCADLLGHGQGLLVRDGLHLTGSEGLSGRAIVSQVELSADKDDGDVGGMVIDLGVPLENCDHDVSRVEAEGGE